MTELEAKITNDKILTFINYFNSFLLNWLWYLPSTTYTLPKIRLNVPSDTRAEMYSLGLLHNWGKWIGWESMPSNTSLFQCIVTALYQWYCLSETTANILPKTVGWNLPLKLYTLYIFWSTLFSINCSICWLR